jgi:hypothetical protein
VEPPEASRATQTTNVTSITRQGQQRQQQTQQTQGPVWSHELPSGSLFAAGVLVALDRRRRQRLWERAFGTRLAESTGRAALTERELTLSADDPGVMVLDRGLRQLARTLSERGRTPPTVFAAHLASDHLDLWVTPPDENAPYPWAVADDGQVWRLATQANDVAGPAASRLDPGYGAPAPYPGLVSVGTNPSGRVLVDLEVANGLIAVRGQGPLVRAALAALAVELITSRWSDTMRVTLVGFGAELTVVAPERLQSVGSIDEILPELERRAAAMDRLLDSEGYDTVLTGRSVGYPDEFAPHYLIVGTSLTQRQTDRLRVLAGDRHRTASGYVVAGDVPGASWIWDITDDGMLSFGALGFRLQAQLLPEEQYRGIIDMFSEPETVRLSNPTVGALLGPLRHPAAEIGILGPAMVGAPGPIEPDRLDQVTELVCYIAAHPGGVHLNVLSGALWPRGASANVRDAALERATAWLGGENNLRREPDGRVTLGPAVRVDWQMFRGLIAQAVSATNDAPEAEVSFLRQALNLVRGPVLAGRDSRRYAWLSSDPMLHEATALVADAAHRLSALLYSARDAGGAMDAARAGLRLATDDEQLWRDLVLAAHATGSEHVLRGVVSEICARLAADPVLPRLAPQTEALIDELYPSWRDLAA